MPILLRLEPGVVIYRNVTSSALLPYLSQRLGNHKYHLTIAQGTGNEPLAEAPFDSPNDLTAHIPALVDCSFLSRIHRGRRTIEFSLSWPINLVWGFCRDSMLASAHSSLWLQWLSWCYSHFRATQDNF